VIRAAFIGVDRYLDPQIRDLNGATRDATALWAVLSDSIEGLNASLVTDEAATLKAVTTAFDETLGAATEDDVVLLSFAGHGTRDHRLVFADTRADDLIETTLDMGDLASRFRTTRARMVLLLLDCCFSGGAPARVLDFGLAERSEGLPLADMAGLGRVLFAASAPHQPALEDPQSRHGLFTKAIVDCLLDSDGPVSVIGLADRVVKIVRAEANRFGYEQTPVIFGHVEGEFNIPAGRRGQNYWRLFPERASVKITSNFSDLAPYNIPDEVLQVWKARFPSGLNSLQIASVNDHGVLDGKSLLVVAPTSAGKTFIGEMAAVKAIADGRKAVFLLPYKALVNEKYEDFAELYGRRLNLRVVRCSGDWQDQVGDVLRGKFDIGFFTYEKFLGLSISASYILHQTGLVVLDEAQFITDPGRGMAVELLLTNLVSARKRGVAPQLLALSAVIGDTNSFERWLGSGLLKTTDRPVPLTEGVLDRSGAWRFSLPNGEMEIGQVLDRRLIQQRGKEQSSQDVIVPLVRHLVSQGEKVIVFRNARGSAAGCAEYLARELGLPPAQAAIDTLPQNDLSAMSNRLLRSLTGGVAFHNGDLNRDERVAVERGFREPDGGVHVLVATSTVAAGVNTPASTVIIVETAFPGMAGPQPYTVAQFKNMAGRAGRLGYETQGKAIALAATSFEGETLFRRYVCGQPEPIRSSFDERDPGTWVVRLLAQVSEVRRDSVIDLVANTYGGYLAILRDPTWRDVMIGRLQSLLDRMQVDGLIDRRGENLSLSMLGRVCGESPLSLDSAMQAVELVRQLSPETAALETLLAVVEALPERDQDYTPQSRHGEPGHQDGVAAKFGVGVSRMLRHRARSDRDYYARCKRALIVANWIEGVPSSDIEERYSSNAFNRVGHGDIRGFADGTRFLLEAILRISAIVLEKAASEQDVANLLRRLDLGIPGEALGLTMLPVQLSRGEILIFWRAGLTRVEHVVGMSLSDMEALIGRRAKSVHRQLHK
jgi:ATP-dependent DNA helicase